MKESLDEAKEELKRADHLIYVSLKYTRTVDIIKHTIERLILAFDRIFDSFLKKAKNEGKISEVFEAPAKKCNEIKELYPEDVEINEAIEFYFLLRKLNRAPFERTREFRRHVTMIATVDDEIVNVDIDKINEYYEFTKKFINFAEENHLIE